MRLHVFTTSLKQAHRKARSFQEFMQVSEPTDPGTAWIQEHHPRPRLGFALLWFVSSRCCSVISYRHIIFPIHDVLGKVCSECTEAPAVRSHLRRNAGISESFCLVRSCKILLKDETMKAGLDFPSGFFPKIQLHHAITQFCMIGADQIVKDMNFMKWSTYHCCNIAGDLMSPLF